MLTTPCDRPTPYGKKHSLGHHTQKVSNRPIQARTCFFLESVADTYEFGRSSGSFFRCLGLPLRLLRRIVTTKRTADVCDELTAAGLRRTFTVLPF
jgi:hypothetical protein